MISPSVQMRNISGCVCTHTSLLGYTCTAFTELIVTRRAGTSYALETLAKYIYAVSIKAERLHSCTCGTYISLQIPNIKYFVVITHTQRKPWTPYSSETVESFRTHAERIWEKTIFFVHQASHLLGYRVQDRLDGFGMEDRHGCTEASFTVLGRESEKMKTPDSMSSHDQMRAGSLMAQFMRLITSLESTWCSNCHLFERRARHRSSCSLRTWSCLHLCWTSILCCWSPKERFGVKKKQRLSLLGVGKRSKFLSPRG